MDFTAGTTVWVVVGSLIAGCTFVSGCIAVFLSDIFAV